MRKKTYSAIFIGIHIFILVIWTPALAQSRLDQDILNRFVFRNLGPFRAGSWVTCFAVPEAPLRDHLYTFYVGTRQADSGRPQTPEPHSNRSLISRPKFL